MSTTTTARRRARPAAVEPVDPDDAQRAAGYRRHVERLCGYYRSRRAATRSVPTPSACCSWPRAPASA